MREKMEHGLRKFRGFTRIVFLLSVLIHFVREIRVLF